MERPVTELQLPESEFVYLAGPTDRPWQQFVGRWQAIKPRLAEIFRACGNDRPLRLLDLGSCTGFFALQAAYQHPEADVIGVEGSVGIGNGGVGMAGSARQILRTPAVQTHLRWIRQLSLQNCMVAPEVWDYERICHLASTGRPISDVSFMLSVIHHIDGVSHEQYANAGLSKVDGFVDLFSKLLVLAPNHFVELPYKPWLTEVYETFNTQRGILEAGTKKTGLNWSFVGPLYQSDWFGQRELWLLQVKGDLLPVDLAANPFLQLISEIDPSEEEDPAPAADAPVLPARGRGVVNRGYSDNDADMNSILTGRNNSVFDSSLPMGGVFANDALPNISSCQHVGGNLLMDPSITALCYGGNTAAVEDRIGELLQKSPTPLLVAHLALREAMDEAQTLLQEVRAPGKPETQAKNAAQRPPARTAGPGVAGARAQRPGMAPNLVTA